MMADARELHRPGFPTEPEAFHQDDRISYSKLSNTYLLETEHGQEFEFDAQLKRWVAVLDEADIARQGQAYAVEGVDESAPAVDHAKKKRKQDTAGTEEIGGRLKKTKPAKEPRERQNTAVYITNLPLNTDVQEVESVFKRGGQIAENIDDNGLRIKLYEDDKGRFKGDALVVYFRPESVNLAIDLLDDTDFRLGQEQPGGRMRVSAADRSYKKQSTAPVELNKRDKKRLKEKHDKAESKRGDWSGSDEDRPKLQGKSSHVGKLVTLKHMFTLEELEEDPAAMSDIEEEIRDECAKVGEVIKVTLYDLEPDGVVHVRFKDPSAARNCVEIMDGRYFDNQQVVAYIPVAKETWKKTGKKKADSMLDEDERQAEEIAERKRIENYGKFIEEGDNEGEIEDPTKK